MNHAPRTANATFAATLCDQLWADGLRAAFVAPGSRSTPMALALIEHAGIAVEIFHDERAASFVALGHGIITGVPGLLLCSSGTAGAHFYGAVIEADASVVPLIVCTADRPPELWDRGAPQTINQTRLYGDVVRDFVEPGPPDDIDPATWRALARRLWVAATGPVPGPVHANLSFRDPLTGTPDALSGRLAALAPATFPAPDAAVVSRVADALAAPRGVLVAGRGESDAARVLHLSEKLGWPVLADHRSGCRDPEAPTVIRHFDALLRDQIFGQQQRPDVILRLGEIVSSKALSQWISASAAAGTKVVAARPHGRHIDPEDVATLQFNERGVVAALVDTVSIKTASAAADPTWLTSWSRGDELAERAISTTIDTSEALTEIAIAQAAIEAVPAGGALMVSSSMPVRDVEWFGQNRSDIDVVANRGANGIDGIIATATGIALTGRPTLCLIGDVAFLHDATTLTALRHRAIDLTIVVVNNDGGGIFSFLPQHQLLDAVEYERLFGTPHGTDLAALAAAHGIAVETFRGRIDPPDGVRVVLATTDRSVNLAIHDQVHAAVTKALATDRS